MIGRVTLRDGASAGQEVGTNDLYVTPRYFETLQIPLLAGRAFTDADGPDAQPVLIVNETFARKFFHGANPVGRFLNKDTLIIGVVGDTALSSTGRLVAGAAPLARQETVYRPAAQINDAQFLSVMHAFLQPSWIVRTSGPVEGLTAQMQQAMARADRNLPFSGFYEMKDLMATTLATQRIQAALLAVMASLALVLSAIGVFALVANLVAQRTREIGIRLALGATLREAMLQVGRSTMVASAAGLLMGLLLCAGLLRGLRSVLYGVGVYDPPTLAIVVGTLAIVSLVATAMPALRVARIDPASTLRNE
jgi:hypothetical protein